MALIEEKNLASLLKCTIWLQYDEFFQHNRQLRCSVEPCHALSFSKCTFTVLNYDCPQEDTVVQQGTQRRK